MQQEYYITKYVAQYICRFSYSSRVGTTRRVLQTGRRIGGYTGSLQSKTRSNCTARGLICLLLHVCKDSPGRRPARSCFGRWWWRLSYTPVLETNPPPGSCAPPVQDSKPETRVWVTSHPFLSLYISMYSATSCRRVHLARMSVYCTYRRSKTRTLRRMIVILGAAHIFFSRESRFWLWCWLYAWRGPCASVLLPSLPYLEARLS